MKQLTAHERQVLSDFRVLDSTDRRLLEQIVSALLTRYPKGRA